jgi:DNA-3-methyladenine glycosylase
VPALTETLPRRFYRRDPEFVAKDIIGNHLVRKMENDQTIRGRIVETEAYGGANDPASHAFRGLTQRNSVMFGIPGIAYVYFTYGFHYCLNVVTGNKGSASAVLIRGVEPVEGIDLMRKNRRDPKKDRDLTNGPGKICQAFAVDRKFNGMDLTLRNSPLRIEKGAKKSRINIEASPRIGIRSGIDKIWRYYDSNSEYVSRRPKKLAARLI